MSKDIKLFNMCNHIVDDKQYSIDTCPKCNGKGIYYDLNFDSNGEIITCEGFLKFKQELLKLIYDEKGGNKFHPEWGNAVNGNMIGIKNKNITKVKIEILINDMLEYFKTVQINNQLTFHNMTDSEILESINYINIKECGPTGYSIIVGVTNKNGNYFEQTIKI